MRGEIDSGRRGLPAIARLMAMRLVLTAAIFYTALILIGVGEEGANQGERGLYLSVAFAFFAAACLGLIEGRPRMRSRILWAQIPIDIGVVTGLVHFSGGAESIFTFLYALIPVYAASVLGSRGAFVAFLGACSAYGGLLSGYYAEVIPHYGVALGTGSDLLLSWAVESGLQFFVALLASGLSREMQSVEEALDQRTAALDQLRGLHERTVASLNSGLLTTDLNGQITSFNAEAEKITHRSAWESIGRDLDEVVPGTRERVIRAAGRKDERARIPFTRENGDELHLGIAGSVLRGGDDEQAPGYVMIFQDITGVVAMEEELLRRERLSGLGEFAAGLAHEIRNPLAAISGSVQVLGQENLGQGKSGESDRLMAIVVKEADRLSALIENFLKFARPMPLEHENVRIAPLIDDLFLLSAAARDEGIVCVNQVTADLEAWADAAQLRQVFWNLMRNSCQAMPEGGKVLISACVSKEPVADNRSLEERDEKPDREMVEICFSDTGEGIPEEQLERIFDPFYTTQPGGTGLGLAMVHRMIDSMEGTLKVKSQVGEGTEIRIVLPQAGSCS